MKLNRGTIFAGCAMAAIFSFMTKEPMSSTYTGVAFVLLWIGSAIEK
jgi:hypothetical protein